MYNGFNTIQFIIFSIFTFATLSCKKFVTVKPPVTQIAGNIVFNDDATATATVTGIYSQMMNSSGFASGGIFSISFLNGLSADEFINYSTSNNPFYSNGLMASDPYVTSSVWSEPYQYIYSANAILEGLQSGGPLSNAVKKQLEGEVKFLRAFCYFYLVNEFGDVPLQLSSDYRINNIASRAAAKDIYNQIVKDLNDAVQLLNSDYTFSANERTRPNKWAATALLARAYLYTGDWKNAESNSSAILNNTALFGLVQDPNKVFLKNSVEAIWQLAPIVPGRNTNEAKYFILTTAPVTVSLSDFLMSAFEAGDKRSSNWVSNITVGTTKYYYPYKYKVSGGTPISEYSIVLRVAEQYLIRAEARAQLSNLTGLNGAIGDINVIRNRAGLGNYSGTIDKISVLHAILHERQVELFSEWGHRWLDLKRTAEINNVMTTVAPLKGGVWQNTAQLYPVPLPEIKNNPNIFQNPGY